jgi:glycosyltransferase involved in cell wall biosynthesis
VADPQPVVPSPDAAPQEPTAGAPVSPIPGVEAGTERPRVCVVGSGWMFTSGISQYTYRLSCALADTGHHTSAVLMRRLVPRAVYPGRDRVGRSHPLAYPADMAVCNGVDWWWLPSMLRAVRALRRDRPDVVVFEWWTVAVLHSYLLLAAVARHRGARIVVELHETQDVGEASHVVPRTYLRLLFPLLSRLTDTFLVHSAQDHAAAVSGLGIDGTRCRVVAHGPYDHLAPDHPAPDHPAPGHPAPGQPAPDDPAASPGPPGTPVRLLYFGVVRPYKGLDVLAAAMESLAARPEGRPPIDLTVLGEPWDDHTAPLDALETGPYAATTTVVRRYVSDDELRAELARTDAVVLPYRRSSASGPLHVAMSAGLPVVVSDVPALREVAGDYAGAVFVTPGDAGALAAGLALVGGLVGRRYDDTVSWDSVVAAIDAVHTAGPPAAGPPAAGRPAGRG